MIEDTVFTLEKAIALAATSHEGETDRGGHTYILHPLRVMAALGSEQERMAGVLHDVVENTAITFEDLTVAGAADEIVEAVRALTKLPGETKLEAAERAAKNRIARNVKLADVRDNIDLSRIAQPTDADRARVEVYRQVEALLLASGATLPRRA